MKIQITALLPFLLFSACSHSSTKPNQQTIKPALVTIESSPSRSIEEKTIPEARHQPTFDFAWGDRKFHFYQGKMKRPELNKESNRMYGWGPVLSITDKGKTRVLDLRDDFPSHYISHVFDDPFAGRIFVFLDFGVEGPASSYSVWISEDRGENWHAGANLKRPPDRFPPADLENFYMNFKGEGTAWFRYEAGNLPEAERAGALETDSVYFKSVTKNYGKSWTLDPKPVFSSTLTQEKSRQL